MLSAESAEEVCRQLRQVREAARALGCPLACPFGTLSFLALSLSFMDAHTPLDNRILAPLMPVWVIMLVALAQVRAAAASGAWQQLAMLALLFGISVSGLPDFMSQFTAAVRYGDGFSDRRMNRAPIFNLAGGFSAEQAVYTNAGEFFYLLHNRQTLGLPHLYNPQTRMANPALDSELEAMLATLSETNGVIVWVDYMRFRDYLPTVAFLMDNFPLEVVASLEGGTVLKLREDALGDRG